MNHRVANAYQQMKKKKYPNGAPKDSPDSAAADAENKKRTNLAVPAHVRDPFFRRCFE